MWYILENLVHTGKFSTHWKIQHTLENVVHTGKCSTRGKIQYMLEHLVHAGKFGTYWKIWCILENVVHTGKCTYRKIQYTLENVVHTGKCSAYWKTFIHAVKKSKEFPEAIFTKLPASQTHSVGIPRAKFQPKLSTNLERTGRNPFSALRKV